MGGLDMVPALMAGAAVLHKPSEVTPLSALEIGRGWLEIGAPSVLAVATGRADTGKAVIGNVDYVQFTGSTRTGKAVARQCVDQWTPYRLELGGKDPAIVLADADIDRSAHGIAWGALFNAGQTCVSIERVYVEAPVYDEFVTALVKHVNELRQGQDDRQFRFDIGPLANGVQRDIVQRHVEEAISSGARAVTGGRPTGVGTFFEPTVLVDVDALANMSSFALPMGGWKQSGVGTRWGGAAGMRKYCRPQAITVDRLMVSFNHPLWFPYSKTRIRIIFGAIRAVSAHGLPRLGITKGGK